MRPIASRQPTPASTNGKADRPAANQNVDCNSSRTKAASGRLVSLRGGHPPWMRWAWQSQFPPHPPCRSCARLDRSHRAGIDVYREWWRAGGGRRRYRPGREASRRAPPGRGLLARAPQRLQPVDGEHDVVTLGRKHALKSRGEAAVVFDDENPRPAHVKRYISRLYGFDKTRGLDRVLHFGQRDALVRHQTAGHPRDVGPGRRRDV